MAKTRVSRKSQNTRNTAKRGYNVQDLSKTIASKNILKATATKSKLKFKKNLTPNGGTICERPRPTPISKNESFNVEDVLKTTASKHILKATAIKDKLKLKKNLIPNGGTTCERPRPTPVSKNESFNVQDVLKTTASKHILRATAIKNKLKLKKNPTPNAGTTFKSAKRSKKSFKAKHLNKTTLDKITENILIKPILDKEMMKVGVESLLTLVTKSAENQESKSLFQSDAQHIFLQVASFRVPLASKRYLRFSLPHTLWTDTSNVCLFVKDLSKYRKDFEPTVKHYKDILEANNITIITQVIPLKQVKAEYGQFEQRRQLCNQYDMFLSDAKICGHVLHRLGENFEKKKKVPTPLKMDTKDLKNEITRALSKTMTTLHSNGNSFVIKVGHTRQSPQEILANIKSICDDLSREFPGGWDNIQSLYIKSANSLAVPIYVSMKSANDVKVPKVQSKVAKHSVPVEGEVSTMPGMRVAVLPSGHILTLQEKLDSDLESDTEIQQHSSKVQVGKSKRTKIQKKRSRVNKKGITEKLVNEEGEDELAEAAEEAYLTEWKRKHQDDEDELGKRDDKSETPKKKKKLQENIRRKVFNSLSKVRK